MTNQKVFVLRQKFNGTYFSIRHHVKPSVVVFTNKAEAFRFKGVINIMRKTDKPWQPIIIENVKKNDLIRTCSVSNLDVTFISAHKIEQMNLEASPIECLNYLENVFQGLHGDY